MIFVSRSAIVVNSRFSKENFGIETIKVDRGNRNDDIQLGVSPANKNISKQQIYSVPTK